MSISIQVQRDTDLGRVPSQGCCGNLRKRCIDTCVSSCAARLQRIEGTDSRERSWSKNAEWGCCKLYTLFCLCLCGGCGSDDAQHDNPPSGATTRRTSAATIEIPATLSKSTGAETMTALDYMGTED